MTTGASAITMRSIATQLVGPDEFGDYLILGLLLQIL